MKGLCFWTGRLTLCVALFLCLATAITAQPRTEYRAFWVDTFNTVLNTPADVSTAVNNAKAANANSLFV